MIFGLLLALFAIAIASYFSLPYLLEAKPVLCRRLVFKPKMPARETTVFRQLESFDLTKRGVKNFYIESADQKAILGVWYISPYNNLDKTGIESDNLVENNVTNAPLFIYFHGNSKSRATEWRLNVYRLLSSLGYHVICFDYRGYGDSTGTVTEENDCISDGLAILRYVCASFPESPIFIWGHSLGTGIVGSLVGHLLQNPDPKIRLPNGILLDAPFTCLKDVVQNHYLVKTYKLLPPLHKKLVSVVDKLRVCFNTEYKIERVTNRHMASSGFIPASSVFIIPNPNDNVAHVLEQYVLLHKKSLANCPVPICIIHAEDDKIVPFALGKKLAQTLIESGATSVTFRGYEAKYGYQHNYIHTAPDLPEFIRSFVDSSMKTKEKI